MECHVYISQSATSAEILLSRIELSLISFTTPQWPVMTCSQCSGLAPTSIIPAHIKTCTCVSKHVNNHPQLSTISSNNLRHHAFKSFKGMKICSCSNNLISISQIQTITSVSLICAIILCKHQD